MKQNYYPILDHHKARIATQILLTVTQGKLCALLPTPSPSHKLSWGSGLLGFNTRYSNFTKYRAQDPLRPQSNQCNIIPLSKTKPTHTQPKPQGSSASSGAHHLTNHNNSNFNPTQQPNQHLFSSSSNN